MEFCLDTNICIYAMKGRYPTIEQRMRRIAPASIKIPVMVRAELLLAAEKSSRRKKTLETIMTFLRPFECVPFDAAAADHYAAIRGYLERSGKPIGPNDLIIAATAAARGSVLVTHNTGEFSRVKGLRLEDWTE